MSSPVDPYRDWGAAYVLGSLSPGERREFEGHLAGCPECSGDVASFAGVPGILSAVPRDRALDLLEPEFAAEPPAAVLTGLLAAERSRRWRVRALVAAALVVAAFTGAVVSLAVRPAAPTASTAVPTTASTTAAPTSAPDVAMRQTVPSPVTASVRLVDEPWGTRIDVLCAYAVPAGPPPPEFAYALHVVVAGGASVRVATWTAGPGSTTRPTATTELTRSDITGVEIRLVQKDLVLLRVEF
ncbi:zf-HC2 domain-containing protein [Saccharothrix sp. 6-C]|uniref:zf-HC2 domain-containing protein n=1 Tax=Saccharothrix sp. 6-C TaxID=2781735 RepID=UPI00191748E6|nr:zf-HC2 domain-containing protein [Saccharothrix sp. 6-C]QQQ73839.1 zf-HC2 domain-containing protein [Saccharothrix sp. 6-C]